jgi:transmembrane sensor
MEEEQIIKYMASQLTSEEENDLLKWINQAPENKEKYCKYLNLWALATQEDSYGKATPNEIKKFKSLIADKTRSNRDRYILTLIQYAAIALIALIIGRYVLPIKGTYDSLALKNQIIVPLGSKSNIILPDGSTVLLNAGSKLVYDFSYGKSIREVALEGEAYFKVAKNKGKPFVVQTAKASIKALGTEFNVKSYPEENKTETILVKGSISVRQKSNKKSIKHEPGDVILKPGQKMLIGGDRKSRLRNDSIEKNGTIMQNRGKIEASQIIELANTAIETSWKDDRWIIQGEKLDDLAVLLSRRFNVDIKLMDANLKEYKFSGTIQNETIEQIFDILKLAVPLDYSIDKGKVKWYLNTRLEKDYKEVYKQKNRNN